MSYILQLILLSAKSPVFSHVKSTFSGLQTIRCHGNEDYLISEFNVLQDTNTATFSLFLFLGRWLAVRLEWMCTILICVVAFTCLIAHQCMSLHYSYNYIITLIILDILFLSNVDRCRACLIILIDRRI